MQETSEILIKNMVCSSCIKVIRNNLEELGLEVITIVLGKAKIRNLSGRIDLEAVKSALESEGFELLENKQAAIIEKVKLAIIDFVYSDKIEKVRLKFSDYITTTVEKDYNYVSTIFSTSESVTIEKYFILQKIERAKELLSYNELSLSDIAKKLGYSSISHFSNQFKSIVGVSPKLYRKEGLEDRKSITDLV